MEEQALLTTEPEQAVTIPPDQTVADGAETVENESPGDLQDPPFTLPIKFNKQEYQLSVEEATIYAQKGMKYTTMEPMLNQLRTLAEAKGQTVAALVKDLCGEPKDETERLAEEFRRLRDECPEVDTLDKVPPTVIRQAQENGTPLLYAYLRYHYDENRRIARARAAAQTALEASVGTQRGEQPSSPNPTVAAMVRGVWG